MSDKKKPAVVVNRYQNPCGEAEVFDTSEYREWKAMRRQAEHERAVRERVLQERAFWDRHKTTIPLSVPSPPDDVTLPVHIFESGSLNLCGTPAPELVDMRVEGIGPATCIRLTLSTKTTLYLKPDQIKSWGSEKRRLLLRLKDQADLVVAFPDDNQEDPADLFFEIYKEACHGQDLP